MDAASIERRRHRAADQRRGDVVEKARQHEHHDEHREAAPPVVGQKSRQKDRHPAFLEMAREQREADDEQEQVDEQDPLAREMRGERAGSAVAVERREQELVDRDRRQADQRDPQRVVVQQGDAGEDRGEEEEFDRDAGNGGNVGVHRRCRVRRPPACF